MILPFPIAEPESDAAAELGRKLFSGPVDFLKGVVAMDGLPDADRVEVCFAGRSNVGKSSLLNGLTGRKTLARTSNTPGRTRELNFFDLAGRLMLVDLPGYGYARASKSDIERWNKTLRSYLRGRPNLQRLCLLIDARHGLKEGDLGMMKMLGTSAVVYRVVLTKVDKLSATELESTATKVTAALKTHPAALPELITTSARKNLGISELQSDLAALANPQ